MTVEVLKSKIKHRLLNTEKTICLIKSIGEEPMAEMYLQAEDYKTVLKELDKDNPSLEIINNLGETMAKRIESIRDKIGL